MYVGRNRLGRKDQSRWRAALAALLPIALAIALWSAPAQAVTGGVSGVAPTAALEQCPGRRRRLAFSPMRIAGATWYGPGFYGRRPPVDRSSNRARWASRTGRCPAAPRSSSFTAAVSWSPGSSTAAPTRAATPWTWPMGPAKRSASKAPPAFATR